MLRGSPVCGLGVYGLGLREAKWLCSAHSVPLDMTTLDVPSSRNKRRRAKDQRTNPEGLGAIAWSRNVRGSSDFLGGGGPSLFIHRQGRRSHTHQRLNRTPKDRKLPQRNA